MEWQPIDTAPKDGTVILVGVWEIAPDMASAAWNGKFWSMNYMDEGEFIGSGEAFHNPTHWQPLPEPPK